MTINPMLNVTYQYVRGSLTGAIIAVSEEYRPIVSISDNSISI